MLTPKELRIGNYLQHEEGFTTDYIKVVGLNAENYHINIECCDNLGGCYDNKNNELYPVPLTPEILEKCAIHIVDNDGGRKYYFKKDIEYDYNYVALIDEDWYYHACCFTGGNDGSYVVEIKHLHQLQNLYFALTGEELEVNL